MMNRHGRLIGLVPVALLVLGLGVLLRGGAQPPVPLAGAAAPTSRVVETQPNTFFEAPQFYKGLEEARARRASAPAGEGRLVGGLVPHHILAGVMFSTFYLELEAHPPKTLIVVGPNHENRGQAIITGRRAWATDFGLVEADQEIVDRLVQSGLAAVDEAALSPEHSVGSQMPYIKYHAPSARVVPIILHRGVTRADLERLADALAPLVGPDTMLVASVDFSHYLTRAEAEAKDVMTLDAIQAGDLDALMRMGPDHLDSPGSLGTLMLTMQRLGARGPQVAAHTNAGILLGSDLIETTSYFTFMYRSEGED